MTKKERKKILKLIKNLKDENKIEAVLEMIEDSKACQTDEEWPPIGCDYWVVNSCSSKPEVAKLIEENDYTDKYFSLLQLKESTAEKAIKRFRKVCAWLALMKACENLNNVITDSNLYNYVVEEFEKSGYDFDDLNVEV